jgi:glycosyltransferase involved in cell wall biosynthesis
MRIGIAIDIDPNKYKEIFPENTWQILSRNCNENAAPSVNTLILSYLKAGHYVRVFTLAKDNFSIATENLNIIGIKQYNKYPIKYLWGIFYDGESLRRAISAHLKDLDVLHAHWTYSYAYGSSFFEDKIPVFCTVRDWAPYIWKIESIKNKVFWSFKLIMNHLVFKHKKIHFIANSPYTAQHIKKTYHMDVPIIPNSIHQSFIKYDKHISPLNPIILCISSSNDKRKNIITLLQAFTIFRKEYPNAILQLIGAPFTPENPKIKEWKAKNLLNQVQLIGKISHQVLTKYIDQASMFVSPSLEETFGNTLIESIARKLPVIGGKNSGAVPYVLHHGKAGFLCDVSNPLEIYNTMKNVYTKPSETEKIANQAFTIITQEYNESIVCSQHIDLYQNFHK